MTALDGHEADALDEARVTTEGDRFSGIARLYGTRAYAVIKAARICVIGIGGVGSWTAEALARTGVGAITLVDMDEVCVHNANRQLHALDGQIGRPKVTVLEERIRAIHPGCDVRSVFDFFTEKTAAAILDPGFDLVVDAIDTVPHKCHLIAECWSRGIPVVTVGGAGGRRDPSQVAVGDLNRTEGDRLLRKVRKRLRQKHDLPRGRAAWGIACVHSSEPAQYPSADGETCSTVPDARGSMRLDCESGFGAASFVTGTFGFHAAAAAIDRIIADAMAVPEPEPDANLDPAPQTA